MLIIFNGNTNPNIVIHCLFSHIKMNDNLCRLVGKYKILYKL